MNKKQKTALYGGSVIALLLLVLQAQTKRSFETQLPDFEIPFADIHAQDLYIGWNFMSLGACIGVLAGGYALLAQYRGYDKSPARE